MTRSIVCGKPTISCGRGCTPGALGVVYGGAHRVALGRGESAIAAGVVDALRAGRGEREAGVALLAALAQAHWTIHRAFLDYQAAAESEPSAVSGGQMGSSGQSPPRLSMARAMRASGVRNP
jgi:hypothetical protein